jgi:hypothetical protein
VQRFPDPVGCRTGFERACELARTSGDDWCLVDSMGNLAWSYQQVCDEHDAGERVHAGMLERAERNGYRDFVAWYWLMESWRPLVRAEADRFHELVNRALAAAREVGEPVTEATGEMWIAWLELEQGRAEEALSRMEAVQERMIAAGAGIVLPYLELRLAESRAVLGDLDGARAGLEPLIASGVDFGWGLALTTFKLADVLRVSGDTAGAEARAPRGARD